MGDLHKHRPCGVGMFGVVSFSGLQLIASASRAKKKAVTHHHLHQKVSPYNNATRLPRRHHQTIRESELARAKEKLRLNVDAPEK